jgi:toluene monooxygenase system protein E
VSEAGSTRPVRKAPKTWSQLSTGRRKPSEYEVVTHNLNYHFENPTSQAPFELDVNTPMNAWYLKHREGSALKVGNWNEFRDPHKLTYRAYIEQQNRRETYLDGVVERFEADTDRHRLTADWVQVLGRLYLPSRFASHVLQMVSMYLAQISPASYITNCAEFQGADEMRRIQRIAYRAKSLSLQFGEEFADTQVARGIWEDDEAWQPMRKCLEELLIAYDWGEAFVGLNLCVKPIYDEFFISVLGELAAKEGDEELALMVDDFRLDSRRSKDWSAALVTYAIGLRPENREVIQEWVDAWRPRAEAGIEGLSAMIVDRKWPADRGEVGQVVAEAYDGFLAECGLATQAV